MVVIIPESITVHLGAPSEDAPNVTVPFIDYIKNVASGEIYPTWPEAAIRANIYAQITFALMWFWKGVLHHILQLIAMVLLQFAPVFRNGVR